MQLRKVQKKKTKLKIGIASPSGFGKTYSSLLMAYGMVGDWGKVAIIDTENGSADLYEDLGGYQVLPLAPPYSPERYIEAIDTCVSAGMEVIIVDSITHEWSGTGGILDIKEQMGGSFAVWAKLKPRHQKFVDKILQSPIHVITTVRKKQEYEMYKDDKGKNKVEKKGMKEETSPGFEYELTLNLEILNENHYAAASKDRTGLFDGNPEFVITEETGKQLIAWANAGVDEVEEMEMAFTAVTTLDELKETGKKYLHMKNNPRYMKAGSQAKERVTPKAQAS
jgi:hypothetical protein